MVGAVETPAGKIKVTWAHTEGMVNNFKVTITPGIGTLQKSDFVTTDGSLLECTIPDLVKGQTYSVTVTAVSNTVDSMASASKSVTLKPSTPTMVGAVETPAGKIKVTWAHTEGMVNNFKVTITPGIGTLQKSDFVTTDDSLREYTTPDLVKGQTYSVTVTAVSNTVDSMASASKSVTLKPSTPTMVGAVETPAGKIKVTWAHTEGMVNNFKVTFTPGIGTLQKSDFVTTDDSLREYTTPDLVKGQTYSVTVTAVSNTVDSMASASKSVTLKPSTPTMVGAVETPAGKIKVTWAHTEGMVNNFKVTITPGIGTLQKSDFVTTDDSLREYTTSDLVKGQTYSVTVTAVSNTVDSMASASKSVTLKPSTPTMVGAVETPAGKITVTWAHTEGMVNNFKVTITPGIGTLQKSDFVTTDDSLREYTTPDLVKGQTYSVTVTAVSNTVDSMASASKSVTLKPSTPTMVGAVETPAGKIKVTWAHTEGMVNNFKVTITPGIGTLQKSDFVTTDDSLREYTTPDLVKGQTYSVTVTAVSNTVDSMASASKSVTLKPSTPTMVGAVETPAGKIKVTWAHTEGMVNNFKVTITPGIGTLQKSDFVTTDGSLREYTTPDVVKGQTYSVTVTAVSNTVDSMASSSKSVTLKPSTPTMVGAVETPAGKIKVTWAHTEGMVNNFKVTITPGIGTLQKSDFVTTDGSLREYTTPDVVKGQTYSVTVTAVSNTVDSMASSSKSVTLTPVTPTGVSITEITTSSVTVRMTLAPGKLTRIIVELTEGVGGTITTGTWILNETLTTADSKSVTVTGLSQNLTPGCQYSVRVKTKSGSKEGLAYSGSSQSSTVAPSEPTTLRLRPGDRAVTAQWNKGPGKVDHFIVWITGNIDKTDVNKEQTVPYQNFQENYSYTFPNLDSGQYTAWVRAVSYRVNSTARSSAKITLSAGGVSVQHLVTSRSILLMWNITDNGITSYLILVMNDQSCLQQIQFTKDEPSNTSGQGSCSQLKAESYESKMAIGSPLTYNVTDLLPNTDYTVQFTPYTNADADNMTTLSIRTMEEVPGVVTGIVVTRRGATEVYVCWQIPQINPGVTTYTIQVIDQEEDSDKNGLVFKTTVVMGYPNNCTLNGNLGGLEEFWYYSIAINASTSVGWSDTANSKKFRTVAAAPGKLQRFGIDQIPGDFTSVNVVWQAPSKRERNSNITQYTIIYTCTEKLGEGNQTEDKTVNVTAQALLSQDQTKQLSIKPEYTCNFTIYAISQEGLRGVMSNIWQHETLPGPPPMPKVNVITSPEEKPQVHETQFEVQINSSLFRDNTNGHVTDYGIIVASTDHPVTVDDKQKSLPSTKFKSGFLNWYEARQTNFPPYRATPLDWSYTTDSRKKRAASGSDIITFQVGSDQTCTDASQDTYCNGPVSDGTEYSVKVFACTEGGCTATQFQENFTTKAIKKDTNIAIIIGIVAGGVIAILLIIIIILVVRVRRRRNHKAKQNQHVRLEPIDRDDDMDEQVPVVDRPRSQPIRLGDLSEVVDAMHRDSNLKFSEQYNWIKELSPRSAANAALLDPNRPKNRYTDILAFDTSRVKLFPLEDDEASDYINANYIPGYHSQREYIAAQGPLKGTVEDFWRMIWEQEVSIIVMLTSCMEKGQNKCEQYWPDEQDGPCGYGDVVVELLSESTINSYTLREIQASMGDTVHKIQQFHFLDWFDHNVSKDSDLADFIEVVRSFVRPHMSGPLLIHCSAGVGRTGTFIAVDQLAQKINDRTNSLNSNIDIYGLVLNMRHYRPRMVQTESQYVLIHDTVQKVVHRRCQADEAPDHVYGNVAFAEDNLYANTDFHKAEEALYANFDIKAEPRTEL